MFKQCKTSKFTKAKSKTRVLNPGNFPLGGEFCIFKGEFVFNVIEHFIYQGWPTHGSRAACGSLPSFMRLFLQVLVRVLVA